MATESLILEFKEKGGRVVKRNIEDIGRSSKKSSAALNLLKRAIVGLSAVMAVRQILRYGEAWTRVNNSLRASISSSQSLLVAQKDVIDIARSARAPLEQVASLYGGIAAASNELNVSQKEIARFTELASKSISIMGSNTSTAAGALLQLRQAIGGSVIQAQEFNSLIDGARPLLEAVAMGSDRFGGSVNKLREEVKKGTVTSKEFFDAALKGSDIIDKRFSKTTITAAQALTVFSNKMTVAIGSSKAYATAQVALTSSLTGIADNIGAIGDAAIVVGVAIVAKFLVPFVVNMAKATKAQLAFNIAVIKGNAIALGSAEAGLRKAQTTATAQLAAQKTASVASIKIVREAARARVEAARTAGAAEIAAAKASASADLQKVRSSAMIAAQNLNKAKSEHAAAQASLASVASTHTLIVAERELEVVRLRNQISSKGRQMSLTRLAEVRKAEVVVIRQQTLALKNLELTRKAAAASQLASTAADGAAFTASTRATASITAASAANAANVRSASAAAGDEIKRATAQGAAAVTAAGVVSKKATADLSDGLKKNTLLARAGTKVMQVFMSAVALVGGPIAAIGIALVGTATALVVFADKIKIPGREFATLQDVAVVTFDRIKKAIQPVGEFLSTTFTEIIEKLKGKFPEINVSFDDVVKRVGKSAERLVKLFLKPIDTVVGLFLGLRMAMGAAFSDLDIILKNPLDALIVVATMSFNRLIDIVDTSLNAIVNAANSISSIINIEIPNVEFPRIELPDGIDKEALNTGVKIANAFAKGLNSNVVSDSLTAIGAGISSGVKSILDDADKRAKKRLSEVKSAGEGGGKIEVQQVNQVRIDALNEINRALQQEADLLELSGRAREIQNSFLQIENSLRTKGITLNKQESVAIQDQLRNIEVLRTRNQVLEEVTGAQEEMNNKIVAFNQLLKDNAITQQQVNKILMDSNPSLFKNTRVEMDAFAEQYRQTMETISQLREANIIDENTAAKARLQVWAEGQKAQLQQANDFFGGLAQLQGSNNKKMAAIGKAAAIVQTTINTYTSATAAYAAMAGIPVVGPALGAVAAAAAVAAGLMNVARIRSTGNRALGGDANPNQLLRVGENNRPEIFRGDSGKQFFIPPERGRVEPLKARSDQPRQGQQQSINVPTPQVNMTNVNYIDPGLFEEFMQTPRGEAVLINLISRNSNQVSQAINNRRG